MVILGIIADITSIMSGFFDPWNYQTQMPRKGLLPGGIFAGDQISWKDEDETLGYQ
jgi:hypothetical protein